MLSGLLANLCHQGCTNALSLKVTVDKEFADLASVRRIRFWRQV